MNAITMNKVLEGLDDFELLSLIATQQDKAALAEFYNRYRKSLGGFLRGRLYQDKLVDEVYNDVMLTVWQKAAAFRNESKVSTWVFGIAYRTCLSHSRKELKHTANSSDMDMQTMTDEQDSELVEHLRAAVTELSDDHKMVVELAYFYGHSTAEIADIMRCPINTVKTRLFHARKNLKHIIEKQYA
ncbi:MAG: RNA polymerase sigma factor [Arenicella sp.]|nr:RNA polymerase sigma factor [Arenicella sp.]